MYTLYLISVLVKIKEKCCDPVRYRVVLRLHGDSIPALDYVEFL